jgi:hypothetical protein
LDSGIFLAPVAVPLLLLHAVLAVVLSGAIGHLVVLAVQRLRGAEVPSARMLRHLRTALITLCASFAVGLLIYPHYRYNVRGLVLEKSAPWAVELFELKEAFAVFTVPVALALWSVERSARAPRSAAWLAVSLGALCAFVVLAGLVVTNQKGL